MSETGVANVAAMDTFERKVFIELVDWAKNIVSMAPTSGESRDFEHHAKNLDISSANTGSANTGSASQLASKLSFRRHMARFSMSLEDGAFVIGSTSGRSRAKSCVESDLSDLLR